MSQITENFRQVERLIQKACKASARDRAGIELLAVSKMQDVEKLDEALATGQRVFAENRVQEASDHWESRRQECPDLKLHLIGPLQTNKVREAVAFFDMVHTLDRENLIDALAKEMEKQGKNLPCFIQVNTGGEAQKAGVAIAELPALLQYALVRQINVVGLMCIPPVNEPAGLHFALLKKLGLRHGLTKLSMGMSHDYEKAIKLGATHIRVGTALFGSR